MTVALVHESVPVSGAAPDPTRPPPGDKILRVIAGPGVWEVRNDAGNNVLYWTPSFAAAVAHARLLAEISLPSAVVVEDLNGRVVEVIAAAGG